MNLLVIEYIDDNNTIVTNYKTRERYLVQKSEALFVLYATTGEKLYGAKHISRLLDFLRGNMQDALIRELLDEVQHEVS